RHGARPRRRARPGPEPYEILDGTLRHALPPAIDGDRIYVAFFGLSSYVLLARGLRTGRVIWRLDLARSSRGRSVSSRARP
nr:hypothetical protein [Deltaproteobacteria bacterium]